jgi:hypothetical protein
MHGLEVYCAGSIFNAEKSVDRYREQQLQNVPRIQVWNLALLLSFLSSELQS